MKQYSILIVACLYYYILTLSCALSYLMTAY